MMEKQGFGFHPEKWTTAIEQCRAVINTLETSDAVDDDVEELKSLLLSAPRMMVALDGKPSVEIMRPFFSKAPSEEQAKKKFTDLAKAVARYARDGWGACLNGDMATAWKNTAITILLSSDIGGLDRPHAVRESEGQVSAEQIKRKYLSQNGKAGAEKRHAPMRKLKLFVLEKYEARESKKESATRAARAIKEEVMKYGESIGAELTQDNAVRKISEWILENRKN